MASFEFRLPEEEGLTVLQNLRRSQLLQLARAYGVPHPPNCNKDKLLPLLEISLQITAGGKIAALDGSDPPNPEFLLPAGDRPYAIARRKAAQERKAAEKKKPKKNKEVIKGSAGKEFPNLTIKFRGPKHRWCVMNGDEVVQSGIQVKEDAIAACG